MQNKQTNRLFLAVTPPADLRQAIVDWRMLHLCGIEGKMVPAENLHLTLSFLGEVSQQQQQTLCLKLDSLIAGQFAVKLNRIGCFAKARVLHLYPSSTETAHRQLAEQCRQLALQTGIAQERRNYRPHLTLLRKYRAEALELTPPQFSWQCAHFSLYRSASGPNGVRYTPLEHWSLN